MTQHTHLRGSGRDLLANAEKEIAQLRQDKAELLEALECIKRYLKIVRCEPLSSRGKSLYTAKTAIAKHGKES